MFQEFSGEIPEFVSNNRIASIDLYELSHSNKRKLQHEFHNGA